MGGLSDVWIYKRDNRNENITYCPKCGEKIYEFYGDGTAKCEECGFHFGVVECEEEED